MMLDKQTNLAVSADLTTAQSVLDLAEAVGADICLFKIHADIIADFTQEFTQKLKAIAEKQNFLIMEDRKFSDIGFTVSHQLSGGVHRIADWADLVTLHGVPGAGIVDGLTAGLKQSARKVGTCFEMGQSP